MITTIELFRAEGIVMITTIELFSHMPKVPLSHLVQYHQFLIVKRRSFLFCQSFRRIKFKAVRNTQFWCQSLKTQTESHINPALVRKQMFSIDLFTREIKAVRVEVEQWHFQESELEADQPYHFNNVVIMNKLGIGMKRDLFLRV